jgi:hypothetical protein
MTILDGVICLCGLLVVVYIVGLVRDRDDEQGSDV